MLVVPAGADVQLGNLRKPGPEPFRAACFQGFRVTEAYRSVHPVTPEWGEKWGEARAAKQLKQHREDYLYSYRPTL